MSNSGPPHVLTFDLEDWFHCLSPEPDTWGQFERRAEIATRLVLELLDRCSATATFFVLGDVARCAPRLVREIAAQGHEIGTHGQEHRFLYEQEPAAFRADLVTSIDLLQDIVGARVCSYRAPYFSITQASLWALDILAEVGITRDSSIFPIRNPRYGIPAAPRTPHEIRPGLHEWPISTLPTPLGNVPFAGGFYFRVLPGFAIRKGVRSLEKRREPVVIYLHPWEFDPGQPRYRTSSRFLNFRHYLGLAATEAKLEAVLKTGKYTSLAVADKAMPAEGTA